MVWSPKKVIKQACTNIIEINIFIHLHVRCLHRLIHLKRKEIEESISLTTASFELLMTPSCTGKIPLQHHFLRCDANGNVSRKAFQNISDSTRMYTVWVKMTHQLDRIHVLLFPTQKKRSAFELSPVLGLQKSVRITATQ